MIKTEINVYTKNEEREIERKLKETEYTKTSDCMWVKIWNKGNNEIIVSREY